MVSTCAVALLAVSGGKAWADAKPKIAVLGLEVADSGTGIDPETTRVAKDLTAALRGRPGNNAGPYILAANGDKELIDEKLLNNCDTEAPVCMSAIGTELGADVLMYGKIEKKPASAGSVYQVSLKLLYVARKQVSSTQESLPVADAAAGKSAGYAKTWYSKLTGGVAGVSVAIKANVDRGTVLIDDEAKGSLTSGSASISGIAEGRHTLAIEAKDYQRYEATITVRNGETLSHTATLAPMSKTAPPPTSTNVAVAPMPTAGHKSNIWKPIFYTSAALDAAAIGFTVYEWRHGVSEGKKVEQISSGDGSPVNVAKSLGHNNPDASD
ncbi:MAG TPA: PEGA domain-containing protein, partial [Kofleriaceae bacterium]